LTSVPTPESLLLVPVALSSVLLVAEVRVDQAVDRGVSAGGERAGDEPGERQQSGGEGWAQAHAHVSFLAMDVGRWGES